MTSASAHARSIQKEFGVELHTTSESLEAARLKLEATFDEDRRGLRDVVSSHVDLAKVDRIYEDHEFRLKEALLRRRNDERTSTEQQLLCVLARVVTSHYMALGLLDRLLDFVREPSPKQTKVRGYSTQIHHILDDYCHFFDLAYMLAGQSGQSLRISSDVWPFQLDYAIEDLFLSPTATQDAAPFLIRSMLEISIRHAIFRSDFPGGRRYAPASHLGLPKLLKTCENVGIQFNKPYDILHRVWDNLNLVVHLGTRLPSSMVWSMYFTAKGTKPMASSKEAFVPEALRVMKVLESENLVERIDGKSDGLTIYWRS